MFLERRRKPNGLVGGRLVFGRRKRRKGRCREEEMILVQKAGGGRRVGVGDGTDT
jgi:hypothetical protein